jgi:ABC-type Fe3+ transport system permease subunit
MYDMGGLARKAAQAGLSPLGGGDLNRFVFHIVASVICILLPIVGVVYGLWDSHQPKIGPLGDGKAIYPTIPQWISITSSFLIGVLNLPLAIMRYRQNIKNQAGRDS